MVDSEYSIEDEAPIILANIESGKRLKMSEPQRKYIDKHANITDETPIETIPPIEESAGMLSANPTDEEIAHYIEFPLRFAVRKLVTLGMHPYTSSANRTDLEELGFKWKGIINQPATTIGIRWESQAHNIHPTATNIQVADELVRTHQAFLVVAPCEHRSHA